MNTRLLVGLSVLVLAACRGTETTAPSAPSQAPSLAISDGAHSSGNPDFFFLPPIVLPTSSLANWTHDGFNGALSPSVEICRLVATTVAAVATAAGSQCMPTPAPVVLSGTQVKKHFPPLADPTDAITGLPGDWAHYHAKWPIPSNCTTSFFYRVRVKVGAAELGSADVQCVTGLLQLFTLDYRKFGPAIRGTTLQIPFRVEKFALCPVPGVGPCSSATVDLAAGGVVNLLSGTQTVGGVDIPAQGGSPEPTTITVKPCVNGSLPIDLPQYGTCLTVQSDPVVDGENALTLPASVYDCTVTLDANLPAHPQLELVTLHRLHSGIVEALPHSTDHCPTIVGASSGSVKGLLAALTHREWKTARDQVFGLLAPKPLYARRLDVGAGGQTFGFSDFRFALPCKLQIVSVNSQVAAPGSLLPSAPTVKCTDLHNAPVAGATVRFQGDGVLATSLQTPGGAGEVSVPWTIPNVGANTLTANGRGLGGDDFNGPRGGGTGTANVDPFQAFPFPPESGPASGPVQLKTGSVIFTATGVIAYGADGYRYLLAGQGGASGFEATGFDDSSWLLGAAPFGGGPFPYDDCALYNTGLATTWPIGNTSAGGGSDLLLRRHFNLPSVATIKVSVAIDNDVQVFLNGTDISGGLTTHEGCAERPTGGSAFIFSGTGVAGSNVLAIRARDRGVISYLDVEVVKVP